MSVLGLPPLLKQRVPALGAGVVGLERWRLTALFAAYAVFATAVYLGTGLGRLEPTFSPVGRSAALVVGFFFLPSLVEELFWRWLLISPERLGRLEGRTWASIGFSTALFTAAHPLAAWLFVPHARPMFWRAEFLVIVFALGLVCGLSYVLSKSIWPAVLIHWATVVAWKFLFGGPFIMLGR
ncbi:CPBP family glutamic-type intramembrane protease [Botrimarina sp.]|uniref:CPBP family glutamic-type intramembrane protease n=1 Tax=Botrimarina sp. TaxID=2795802 RepID=UPI0032ED84F5